MIDEDATFAQCIKMRLECRIGGAFLYKIIDPLTLTPIGGQGFFSRGGEGPFQRVEDLLPPYTFFKGVRIQFFI